MTLQTLPSRKKLKSNYSTPSPYPCIHTLGNASRIVTKSNYALKLEKYYVRKFGNTVTPIALLKTLAVISSGFKHNWKLWVLNVAPSRHLKSVTTQEQAEIFPKSRLVYVGSDFTIHNMNLRYEGGKKLNGRCMLINDMTLLLASKEGRTKSRLIDGLSELASEGKYIYGDFDKTFEIIARFSLVSNITPHSFFRNRKDLLGNTFIERCLVVFHTLSDQEMISGFSELDRRTGLKAEKMKSSVCENDVRVNRSDLLRFLSYGKHWRTVGGYSSITQVSQIVKSIAVAYAILSGHRKITEAEFRFLDLLSPYISNPEEKTKLQILQFSKDGKTVREICEKLNRNYEKYKAFVYRTVAEYREKGLLPS